MFDAKAWKRQLATMLREHPDITSQTTGQIEINLNRGAITKIYSLAMETKDEGATKITTKTELK